MGPAYGRAYKSCLQIVLHRARSGRQLFCSMREPPMLVSGSTWQIEMSIGLPIDSRRMMSLWMSVFILAVSASLLFNAVLGLSGVLGRTKRTSGKPVEILAPSARA